MLPSGAVARVVSRAGLEGLGARCPPIYTENARGRPYVPSDRFGLWRSCVLRWTPCHSCFSVTSAKEHSTRLIRETPFGVKGRAGSMVATRPYFQATLRIGKQRSLVIPSPTFPMRPRFFIGITSPGCTSSQHRTKTAPHSGARFNEARTPAPAVGAGGRVMTSASGSRLCASGPAGSGHRRARRWVVLSLPVPAGHLGCRRGAG